MTPLTKFWATISQEIEPEISCGLLEKVACQFLSIDKLLFRQSLGGNAACIPSHYILAKNSRAGKPRSSWGRGRRNQMKPVICSGIYIGNNTVPDILPTLSGTRKNYFHGFPRQERAAKETGLQVYTDAGEPQFVTAASRRKFCAAQSEKETAQSQSLSGGCFLCLYSGLSAQSCACSGSCACSWG